MSMLGIWWPRWFEWPDYHDTWDASLWFTFGIGFLAVIFLTRFFMSEDEDRYLSANKIIVGICCISGGLLFGKAVLTYQPNREQGVFFFDFTYLECAIYITIFVWLFNFVSVNKHDDADAENTLGGAL